MGFETGERSWAAAKGFFGLFLRKAQAQAERAYPLRRECRLGLHVSMGRFDLNENVGTGAA